MADMIAVSVGVGCEMSLRVESKRVTWRILTGHGFESLKNLSCRTCYCNPSGLTGIMAVVRSNSIDANSEGHTMGGGAYVDGGNGCGYDMDLTGFNIDFPIAGVSTPESLPLYSKPRPTYTLPEHPMGSKRELKVIFVGMGASGINFAYQLQQQTELVELQIYEKNVCTPHLWKRKIACLTARQDQLGGTWYENRYPGCACDIPSVGYQFSW